MIRVKRPFWMNMTLGILNAIDNDLMASQIIPHNIMLGVRLEQ